MSFENLQKLLQRGQERDQFLAEVSQKMEQDHVLELRQTIQTMQVKLDEREGKTLRSLNPHTGYFKFMLL